MPRSPNDPRDPSRPAVGDYASDREARLEREAQFDPELAEGPASTGKIALFAVAIALVLGAVFYGLNNSSLDHASTSPPAQTAQTRPANPANSRPGLTTGSATNRPTPPQSSPTGPEIDRADNPTAGQNNDNR
jgi:hypothetical protein